MRKSYLKYTNHPTPRAIYIGQIYISGAELKSSQNGFRGKNTRSAATNLTQPRSTKSSRVSQSTAFAKRCSQNRSAKPTQDLGLPPPQHKAAMRLVPILLIMTTALAEDETRDWFRIRRTPGVRRAKGERMRGVSMTKGLNPPSKHGWPVDHPTMPRRDDHPGRPLKSRAAHIRRKRDETREKHREKTRRAKEHRDEGALR